MEDEAAHVGDLPLAVLVNLLADLTLGPLPDPWSRETGRWGAAINDALGWLSPAEPWGPNPEPWRLAAQDDDDWWKDYHPGPRPWLLGALAGLPVDDITGFGSFGRPKPNTILALVRFLQGLNLLNPQPLPPVDGPARFVRALGAVVVRRAAQERGDAGGRLITQFVDDWCGNQILIPPHLRRPPKGSEPRPPRPNESLLLGAAMISAAGPVPDELVAAAARAGGEAVIKHGLTRT